MKKVIVATSQAAWQLLHSRLLIIVAVVLLSVGAIFTRFYQLDRIPAPWHIDEAGMAYDAYSLAYWRVERHMMHLPVYLPNYGDGQSALYAYLTAVFVRIFSDINPFVARLPAALFSLAAIVFSALIVHKIYGWRWALMTAFLVTIFPYFLMQGRYGLDCNLFLATSIIALYFTLQAISSQKYLHFAVAGVAWSVTLYAYALSWVVVPAFLVLLLSYLFIVKKITIPKLVNFGLPLFLLALPLIVFCVIEIFDLMPVYSRFYYIPRLSNNRIDSFTLFNFSNFLRLPKLLFWVQDGEAYLHYPTFYWISVPFALVGMWSSGRELIQKTRQKKWSASSLILFFFIANLLSMSMNSVNSNDTHHINSIFGPMALFIVIGIVTTYRWIKERWQVTSATIFLTVLLTWLSVAFVWFTYQYFVVFPRVPTFAKTFMYSPTTDQILAQLDEYGRQHGIEQAVAERNIWLDISRYTFYYLGAKTPPTEMNLTADILNEVRFGNVHFSFMPGQGTQYCRGLTFCPEDISDQDIYIVANRNTEYMDRLRAVGLESVYQDDGFTIFLKLASFRSE